MAIEFLPHRALLFNVARHVIRRFLLEASLRVKFIYRLVCYSAPFAYAMPVIALPTVPVHDPYLHRLVHDIQLTDVKTGSCRTGNSGTRIAGMLSAKRRRIAERVGKLNFTRKEASEQKSPDHVSSGRLE